MKILSCRSCKGSDIKQFFDLGEQPFANSLLSTQDEPEKVYPLSLSWCGTCNLVQLDYTADPKELFSKYVWVTGTSKTASEFAKTFFKELIKRSSNEKPNYILEIASNDGTFLKPIKEAGYEVLGIDPAENIAEMAEKAGIPTRVAFWGKEAAEHLITEKGKPEIIFARNVLMHVANTHDFVEGLATALNEEGVLAIEIHYSKIIQEELHYDYIYHEHLCYFTFKTLERLLHSQGLFIFDMVTSPISGGSIIVYASKKKKEETAIVQEYRDSEIKAKTNDLLAWEEFAKKSFEHKDTLLNLIRAAQKNVDVVGYGASARSSTMLNFCKIDNQMIRVIADKNPLKQGKFTAGTRIPIDKPEAVMARNPKTILLLAWNFADEIPDYLEKEFHFKGEYIIPLPHEPRIVKSRLA